MNILLTGASGMLGHNILEHDASKHYCFYTPSSQELNLLNLDNVKSYFSQYDIDLVIHCAGKVGGIQANILNPVGFFNENLQMGINLVNVAFDYKIKNLFNLASSCMYPRDYINPLKEEYLLKAPLEPTNEGYALAKISVAKLCQYINEQYNMCYYNLIPCNLYGRWDNFDKTKSHMIPAVIRKLHEAKLNNFSDVEIWGDGEARREFMYALDCADAIFYLINKIDKLNNYTNIGLGYDYSINKYYNEIAKIVGYSGKFKHDLNKPVGMNQKLLDTTVLDKLGWKPHFDLSRGIKETYDFYLESVKI